MQHDDYQDKQAAQVEQSRIERPRPDVADPWRHRSAGMRCQSCMWFVRKEPAGLIGSVKAAEVGRCRRHAPTMNGYPVVYMSDWCGDHRIDENKV